MKRLINSYTFVSLLRGFLVRKSLRNHWFLNKNIIPYYTSPACCEVVNYQISRHQNQLSSIVTMKNDGVNEERLQHLSKQWEQELIYLQNLKKSLMNSDYEEKFNFEYADIGVKPKEVTDKGK